MVHREKKALAKVRAAVIVKKIAIDRVMTATAKAGPVARILLKRQHGTRAGREQPPFPPQRWNLTQRTHMGHLL
jgi:hypothetical protein